MKQSFEYVIMNLKYLHLSLIKIKGRKLNMDTVKLMYLYRNKYINSDELLEELENLDLSIFSQNETKQIHQLVCDIKKIKDTIPNEVDKYEKQRMKSIDRTIESLEKLKKASRNLLNTAIDYYNHKYFEKENQTKTR